MCVWAKSSLDIMDRLITVADIRSDHQASVPQTPLKLGGAPGILCVMLRAGEGSEMLVSISILPFLPTYDIAASA